MHAERIKRLWTKRSLSYKRKSEQDLLLVRQYSMLLAVLVISVAYRVLAVIAVHVIYLHLHCETSGDSGYVLTVSAENACFVSIFLWSTGASAASSWTAGLANRLVLPLLQAAFFGCFCANVVHFFATAADLPVCWPAYFVGIMWAITWLNVASFVAVSCLLAQLTSPLNLFLAFRQTDREYYDMPAAQTIQRA